MQAIYPSPRDLSFCTRTKPSVASRLLGRWSAGHRHRRCCYHSYLSYYLVVDDQSITRGGCPKRASRVGVGEARTTLIHVRFLHPFPSSSCFSSDNTSPAVLPYSIHAHIANIAACASLPPPSTLLPGIRMDDKTRLSTNVAHSLDIITISIALRSRSPPSCLKSKAISWLSFFSQLLWCFLLSHPKKRK